MILQKVLISQKQHLMTTSSPHLKADCRVFASTPCFRWTPKAAMSCEGQLSPRCFRRISRRLPGSALEIFKTQRPRLVQGRVVSCVWAMFSIFSPQTWMIHGKFKKLKKKHETPHTQCQHIPEEALSDVQVKGQQMFPLLLTTTDF